MKRQAESARLQLRSGCEDAMSEKKSFIVYIDSLSVLDDLNDEQAGKLLRAIRAHHDGVEIELDALTKIAFSPFKAQFARDAQKYAEKSERNRINGLKGGRPKSNINQDEAEKPIGLFGNPDNPQKGDSDSDSDSGKKVRSPKGSRITDGWEMPEEWIDWATSEMRVNHIAARSESERFADYWRSQPGAKGVKASWKATWRNWIRAAIERNPKIANASARPNGPRAFGE